MTSQDGNEHCSKSRELVEGEEPEASQIPSETIPEKVTKELNKLPKKKMPKTDLRMSDSEHAEFVRTSFEKLVRLHTNLIISPYADYKYLEKRALVGDGALSVNEELKPLASLFEKVAKTLRSGKFTSPAVNSILGAWSNSVAGFNVEQIDLEPEIELEQMAEKFDELSKGIITRRRRGRQVNQPQRNIGKAAARAWLSITGANPVKHVLGNRKTNFTEFLDSILIALNLGGSGESIADAILPLPKTKQPKIETDK